ncbi:MULTISPECIES: helix-turn-helix domain-containing protein [Cohnella]|uniref:AraC-like DNA-binding protein n=1 Tax=Cohnella phaseoli TaxID=456490 RepID=A0A3D9KI16_9BACL|nr:AraC family transcriptional regulator [Cohnella phaseoli]RED85526.1 AraC-like DNA-binding protein [Cohnella phaseoli]
MQLRTFKYVEHNSSLEYKTGGIHPSFEILYLATGRYQMNWLGEKYDIKPNSLFFITPNTPHDVTILSNKATYWYIELNEPPANADSVFPTLETILVWNRLQCESDLASQMPEVMNHTVEGIHRLLQNRLHEMVCGEELLLLEIRKLFLIVHEILHGYKKDPGLQKKLKLPLGYTPTQDIIKTLIIILETSYKENITLRQLSDFSHFQSTYLIQKFKEYHGFTPIEYLHKLRMKAAVNYLSTTDMKIKQIAEESGYANIHHFSNAFKKNTGMSPSEWRKNHRSPL